MFLFWKIVFCFVLYTVCSATPLIYTYKGRSCSTNEWRCHDGTCVRFDWKCDGVIHCPDGSDETAQLCKNQSCQSNWFTCSYGACVDGDAPCNGVKDCADNSDETEALCRAPGTPVHTQTVPNTKCILPQFPANGRYRVIGVWFAIPGQQLDAAYLQVSCDVGHKISGTSNVMCLRGIWSNSMPQCNRSCKLISHPSVEYKCIVPGSQVQRDCQEEELVGTVVAPACRPNYYSHTLNHMHCFESGWDYIAICQQNLNKTGTNVTILINDNVNVYISGFDYASQVAAITPAPVTNNELEYQISEDDWRMASVENNRNKTSFVAYASKDNKKIGVNFFISNSTVIVNKL